MQENTIKDKIMDAPSRLLDMRLQSIVNTVYKTLCNYKNMSIISPNWFSVKGHYMIDEEICRYMIYYRIDDKYDEIGSYRKNIDNVFKRAIWYIAKTITISNDNEKTNGCMYDQMYYKDFIDLLLGFYLLSRQKTQTEIMQYESLAKANEATADLDTTINTTINIAINTIINMDDKEIFTPKILLGEIGSLNIDVTKDKFFAMLVDKFKVANKIVTVGECIATYQ